MNEDILQEILTTLKDFKDESNKRWEENDRRWEENQKQWAINRYNYYKRLDGSLNS